MKPPLKYTAAAILAALLALSMQGHASSLELLASLMQGSFSSQEQSMADSAYFDIRLEMVPVWTDRQDGHWFYVEQAVAGQEQRPYRQRVYHLFEGNGGHTSFVYELPDPARFAGRARQENPLGSLGPDSLMARSGCAVFLKQTGDSLFAGGTRGKECNSTLRGATWASSEVEIGPGYIHSWDRGFDDQDLQVWGAEKGPYRFLRQPDPAAEAK
jgi:CpeT protein